MTLPNTANSPRSAVVTRKKRKEVSPEIAALFSLAVLACLLVSFHSTSKLASHHDMSMEHHVANPQAPALKVRTQPLAHEDLFLKTLKSCLPQSNEKCKTYIAEGSTRQRVVLISPPGELTELFFSLIESVVMRDNADIELVHTTHMAPYGYGKTHGYTRIIRLVPHPLLVGVTTTLQSALQPGQTHLDIHMEEVRANLRQQIRFHCRLSHIAAHTALWTLTLDDLVKATLDELVGQIRTFLGINKSADEQFGFGSDIIPPDGMGSLFNPMYNYGASMLTSVQSKMEGNILKDLDDVLLEELRISKNLTAWPCESFWTVGDPNDKLKLTPPISKISQAMSPDCSDPLISCWVKRDLCESKADGKCA